MIVELGHFALWLALAATLIQATVPLRDALRHDPAAMRVGDASAEVQYVATAGAFAALTCAFVVSDFSFLLVAMTSHSMKPMLYEVTGVWATYEGSMLLWVLTLALIGTFLVRSGLLTSAHAFATDPERSVFILLLLGLAIGGALTLFARRANVIRDGGVFATWSRETGLLGKNVLLAACTGAVFVGTLYSLPLELLTGDRISVGAPYFNQTFLPIFTLMMLGAGIGPFLSWKRGRKTDVCGVLRASAFWRLA